MLGFWALRIIKHDLEKLVVRPRKISSIRKYMDHLGLTASGVLLQQVVLMGFKGGVFGVDT